MGAETGIQWTDATWNPVRGCSRISPGCENCYAETMAARFSGKGQWAEGFARRSPARWTRKVAIAEDMLELPLHWKKPRRIFVNSMSDLFHEALDRGQIARVFNVMARCQQHTFQVLTKRADRMEDFFKRASGRMHATLDGEREPLPNVWLGVSVEDQQRADERIPHLLRTPAAVRFLSCEPLLGPLDVRPYITTLDCLACQRCGYRTNRQEPVCPNDGQRMVPDISVDWVIVGGESGAGARPMRLEWARSIVEQCRDAGVKVFVKQLGAMPVVDPHGADLTLPLATEGVVDGDGCALVPLTLFDRKGGDMEEWPVGLRVREFPEVNRG